MHSKALIDINAITNDTWHELVEPDLKIKAVASLVATSENSIFVALKVGVYTQLYC